MEILLSFILGLVLAGLAAFFVIRKEKRTAAADKETALAAAAEKAQSDLTAATARIQSDLENANANLTRVKADSEASTQRLIEAKDKAHEEAMKAKDLAHQNMIEAMEKRHQEAIAAERGRFEQTMGKMSEEMKNVTGEFLKQQQQELKQTNRESVENLLAPLQQKMADMNKLMDDTRREGNENTSSLKGALEQMVKQTESVGKQADNLAEAMKNKGKVHGDWGEQVLDKILEDSGLRDGHEFTTQEVIPLGGNKSYRTDFIINTPEGGRIIVDSKVSLTDYANAIGAETQEEYETFVKKNYESVWSHVLELSKKEYYKYVDGALNYVLMFMPNEGAYVMAMNYNRSLAQDAYRKGIIILNPTNLMLTLNLVLQSWNGTRQKDNCQKIIEAANGMFDKVVGLVDTGTKLSNQIGTVAQTCSELTRQLSEGNGNLLKRVDDLRGLGVTSTKRPKAKKIAKKEGDMAALPETVDEPDEPTNDSPALEE